MHANAATEAALRSFTELWIHTGTACNLECPFCLEGSRPGDNRLERIKLNEIKPHLDEAVTLGVQRFCFTGGEPLIVKDIVKILDHALALKPCLILTNGTAPLLKRVHQLQMLQDKPHPLSFRVSLDYPDQQRHDSGRGWGNFARALEGMQLLHAQGFEVSIARQCAADEDVHAVTEAYRQLLRRAKLPDTLHIVALPEFGKLGTDSQLAETLAVTDELPLMCRHSRMLLKRNGELRIHACALTDDDQRFDMGTSLNAAIAQPVQLQHQRCRQCVRHRATYSETATP